MEPFLSVRELYRRSGPVASFFLTSGVAATIPVPHDGGELPGLLVMYYIGNVRPGGGAVLPPHHALTIDGVTGKVLRSWACRPEDLGIDAAAEPLAARLEASVPPLVAAERHGKRERVFDLSPEVWRLFASGAASFTSEEREMVLEYRQTLAQITRADVLRFYAGAASRFFAWTVAVGADTAA